MNKKRRRRKRRWRKRRKTPMVATKRTKTGRETIKKMTKKMK